MSISSFGSTVNLRVTPFNHAISTVRVADTVSGLLFISCCMVNLEKSRLTFNNFISIATESFSLISFFENTFLLENDRSSLQLLHSFPRQSNRTQIFKAAHSTPVILNNHLLRRWVEIHRVKPSLRP